MARKGKNGDGTLYSHRKEGKTRLVPHTKAKNKFQPGQRSKTKKQNHISIGKEIGEYPAGLKKSVENIP